jgi:hypothetical protein
VNFSSPVVIFSTFYSVDEVNCFYQLLKSLEKKNMSAFSKFITVFESISVITVVDKNLGLSRDRSSSMAQWQT